MEQARKLTGQLLTFSRGGSPVLETTSVRELILDSCRLALSGTAVRCDYDVPADLWMADIDPSQIWQVLNNILTNSREAMPGGGTVWVSAENVTFDGTSSTALGPGDCVKVSIRDHGVGVAKENIPRLFNPYFSTKVRGSQKGTGIGLAVCHSVIEKHGGRITLESELGLGTTVTFFLRALRAEQPPASRTGGEAEVREQGYRVLMLEDDSAVIKTGTQMIEHLGHTVTAVQNGAEVLDLYSRSQRAGKPFDLVLLDLTVRGGMGGRETLEKLKQVDPDVVAVVTSGYADDPVIAEFGRHGFQAALLKPFTIRTLEQTIAQVVPHIGDEKRSCRDGDGI
jgi:two-component system cell cycle sensor histidine kinase/response regulator CckA